MRTLPAAFEAALGSGATTHCWCWRLERFDGHVLGFTDHDRPLEFDGTTFDPETGLSASAAESQLGLAADNSDVVGALRSDQITSADLTNGLYDGAQIRVYRVDWNDPQQRVLMRVARLGEVRYGTGGFSAELVGMLDGLNASILRSFQHHCDARLGDARCGVDLTQPGFQASATVSAVLTSGAVVADGLDGHNAGWFSDGTLTWTTGANTGGASGIAQHRRENGQDILAFWVAPVMPVSAGDSFTITAGCDKRPETCAEKFSNIENFRGFPHMPGNDFFFSYPKSGA